MPARRPSLLAFVLAALFSAASAAQTQTLARPEEKAADPPPAPSPFTQEAQGSFTGQFTAGNVSSLTTGASGYYQMKLFAHALRVDVGGGVRSLAEDTDQNPANGFERSLFEKIHTAGLFKLRYDFFLTERDTLFGSGLTAHDSATNLEVRLRGEAGYRRYFFRTPKHSLSGEVGTVYVVDRAPFDGDTNGDGQIDLHDRVRFEDTGGNVGARAMVQYTNGLLDNLAFNQTLEVVPNLFPDVEAPYEKTRIDPSADGRLGLGEATIIASTTSFMATLDKNLAASLSVTFSWDNGAIARRNAVSNADLATLVTLTYKIF